MKKFYSFALIILSLFSCVLFSACGGKYDNLKIDFYLSNGKLLEEARFVIDDEDSPQTLDIKFRNIDEDDMGQVVVYSVPNYLINVSKYTYSKNTCSVELSPNVSSKNGAKLVVSHLASGKKKQIPLTIEQKSNNVEIYQSKYVVSIPDKNFENRFVDLTKCCDLSPSGSTDKLYFKLDKSVLVNADNSLIDFEGVKVIPLEGVEGLDKVYVGFEVSSVTDETIKESQALKIYPVTYLEDYKEKQQIDEQNQYENKTISVYFKKVLNESNVELVSETEVDTDNIQLIANDDKLCSFKFNLNYLGANIANPDDDMLLNEGNFFDMYEIEHVVLDKTYDNKVSLFVDGMNNIHVTAHDFTDKPVEIKIILNPINFVGDVQSVELSLAVKGELKSNKIEVLKNGEAIKTSGINIFDYYESGSSLGALFTFNPGENVHKDLSKMRIIIDPSILSEENGSGTLPEGVTVNSMLYSLMFRLIDDYLKFTYNETFGAMVSEEIDSTTKVYIKYLVNETGEDPTDDPTDFFGMTVRTINKSTLDHWKELENTETSLDFTPLKGVKSMSLQAGYYYVDDTGYGNHMIYDGAEHVEYVYLNRLEGLDNSDEEINTNFIYVADNVLDADDNKIDKADLIVKIQPLKSVDNPLTLKDGHCNKDFEGNLDEGEQTLLYSYNKNTTNDVLGLVYRSNTSLGDFKITFYQEDIEKASIICRVYESLDKLQETDISLETNKTAFKNQNYRSQYLADYIVASGQNLDVSIDLEQAVLDSNVISGYKFDYKIGLSDGETVLEIEGEKTDYFNIEHDNENTSFAKLQFKKGTYVEDGPKYVYVTITVKEKAYENIIKEAVELKEASIGISFFIYEEIKDNDVNINHTSLLRYPKEYMAIDYKNLSKANLEISMSENLWNYTTNNEIVWNIDGVNIEFEEDYLDSEGELYPDEDASYDERKDYKYNGIIASETNSKESCNFIFTEYAGYDSYTAIIKAYITQFDKIFEVQCIVRVEKPIITESLVIESETFVTEDGEQTPYINLKKGGSYQVVARNVSSLGDVTHPEITIQVADEYGNAYNVKNYFEVNQTTSEIKAINVEGVNKFKLVVFAKDALKEVVSSDKSGYNMPSIFLNDEYSNAYYVIDIYLSDGSEANPYLIKNAYDFWEINETDFNKEAHYLLMSSLSLDDVKDTSIIKTIENFEGNISTYNNDIYNIGGIYLNNSMENLFANFRGEISNIRFSVDYAYDINESDTQYLGLFDSNSGTITNIGVYVRGYANLNGSATYYFGGLAGENLNTIEYKDDEDWNGIVGVDGSIQLKGDAKVYFGGLVGKNISAIIGCEKETTEGGENEIRLSVSGGRENTLSQLTINSELENNSAIGGVVGLNTYDNDTDVVSVIKNAFVQVVINAQKTSNVGGVIGENSQDTSTLKMTMEGYVPSAVHNQFKEVAIYNVKSASTINALDNVGGIVGLDTNGVYLECDYQILSQQYKEISILANNAVGGIAGSSNSGKFLFCSVMSYNWNYAALNGELAKVISDVADISGQDYVGGIVGSSKNSAEPLYAGENNINDRVVVISSSVNAYIQATKMNESFAVGNIGGIHSSYEGSAVIYNAYFLGKLDGAVNYEEIDFGGGNIQYLALDNNGSSHYNAVYTLNLSGLGATTTLKQGSYKDNNEFKIKSIVGELPFWWWNENINGGYIFITNETERDDDTQPIFDLAPESIDVQVKEPKETGLERVLVLDYYDFSIAENLTDAKLLKLIEKANRSQNIIDLLSIEAVPSNLGVVVINIKSTNSNFVDVTYDGRLLINGVGECELIFSSVLNPNAGEVGNRTIKVVVDYPITDLHLSTSRTDKNGYVDNGSTQNIAQNSSRQYYAVTNGVYIDNETSEQFRHKTKTNINFNVEIIYETANADFDITQYLAITGTKRASNKNEYFVDIDEKTPFMISVLKKLETGTFKAKVTPYVIINDIKVNIMENPVEFNLSTLQGITNVSFSYDDAIIYPNDVVYLNAYMSTDHMLTKADIANLINIVTNTSNFKFDLNESNTIVKEYFIKKNETSIGSVSIYINLDAEDDLTDNLQKIKLRLEFSDIYIEEELNLQLQFELGSGVYSSVNYTVLPQRINKIEIKNYYFKNGEAGGIEKVQQDILKPNSFGEMIIDIVPDNGYYDYLEISDITGNEEIVFIQVDENGNSLSLRHDPSSDGKGIKLYDYNLGKNRIYIRTQISNRYSSKMHIIEVRAYSSNGTKIASNRKYIDVKMLPEIEVTYLLPDGRDSFVADSKNADVTGVYLANGVDAMLRIKTLNANTEPEYTISGDVKDRYSLVKISDNLYTLKCNVHNSEDIGKTLKLSFKVYSLLDNGDFDVAECSIEFTITSFVIHGVSVNSSIDNAKTTEIYGYYGKEINFNFYFDETDISFYDNKSFHNTVYEFNSNYKTEYEDKPYLYQIHTILEALNKKSSLYLILNNNQKVTESIKYEEVTPSNLELNGNKLTVQEDYNPKYLAVAFMLNYDISHDEWSITTYDDATSDEGSYIIDKNYKLNFRNAVPMHEAEVITSEEQFKNMTSGGRYILEDDITLTNYTPIDADILEFDGNGNTIEIKSFAPFADVKLKAGLFAQIYPNMIVKNVKVKYVSENYSFGDVSEEEITYGDICDPNVAYTEAKFGGIAAVNNGVITNCVVEGRIAISASVLEKKTFASAGNYEIDFNIGGLVCENTSTGYITNSTTKLEVASLANIGGFIHTNSGKIVSCGVEENSTIYGYNVNLGNTIIVDIAGFAVDNSGEISMSYVNLIKGDVFTRIDNNSVVNVGTMSAKDFSAGFVSNNVGEITDAYVQISEIGVNNNRFAGFVDTNAGNISRAYTFINSGIKASKDDSMFIGQSSGTLNDCIEFVVDNNSSVKGLSSVNITNRNEKAYYEEHNFAFGDNVSAVWSIQAGTLPKLVSTQEFKFESFDAVEIKPILDTNHEDGIDENKFEIIPASYGSKENPFIIHDIETWNYYFNKENVINMLGYYRIVKDIDFSVVGDNPFTTNVTFQGNIQGNNMKLNGIMLYSSEGSTSNEITSIGLFKELVGTNDKNVVNSIRNLTLNATSIWASSTSSVGVLAGIIENFNLYNITIDAESVVMVGRNAVGGVAGIIRGEFDMDQVSSNVGANSTRASTLNNYSIYMSRNNTSNISHNLSKVYYAGSVAGILDGYDRVNYNVNDDRNIDKNYYKVQNVVVSGEISLSGDTVGSAFGFVGEQVLVNKLTVDISGLLSGSEYSGGAIGENRGVLMNSIINIADETFRRSQYVSAGAVGLNLGGLVKDVDVTANIVKNDYSHTVGGIVGRNVNGTIATSHFDGEIFSYFAGGIVGANYSDEILSVATTGTGALNGECKQSTNLIPSSQVVYLCEGEEVESFAEVSLSLNAFNKIIENSSKCYSYRNETATNNGSLTDITIKSRVLGLVVGLSYNSDVVSKTENRYHINYNEKNGITFNVALKDIDGVSYKKNDASADDDAEFTVIFKNSLLEEVKFIFNEFNVLEISSINQPHVIYIVGSVVSSFNSWNTYSNEYILLK